MSNASRQLTNLRAMVNNMEGLTNDQRDAIVVAATVAVRCAIEDINSKAIKLAMDELSEVRVGFMNA